MPFRETGTSVVTTLKVAKRIKLEKNVFIAIPDPEEIATPRQQLNMIIQKAVLIFIVCFIYYYLNPPLDCKLAEGGALMVGQ